MFEYDVEYDDDDIQNSNAFDGTSFRVLADRCTTCIFRPGNLMHLRPGRVKDMCDNAVAGGGYITCHQTLPYGDNPDFAPAVCRGFYDAHGHRTQAVQVAGRLGLVVEVAPPVKEDA